MLLNSAVLVTLMLHFSRVQRAVPGCSGAHRKLLGFSDTDGVLTPLTRSLHVL